MRLSLVFLIVTYNYGFCKNNNRVNDRNSLEASSMEYYTKPGYITIPVIIHFDKALTDRLAKEYRIKTRKKLKEISRSILKEVESYYRHPSLNQSIHFSLLESRFLKKNTVGMDENGSIYLKKYCKWQGDRKMVEKRWWYSILLTGLDVFYINGRGLKIRSSTAHDVFPPSYGMVSSSEVRTSIYSAGRVKSGRGYMGGFCAKTKSCTLLEFDPKNMGYLLAHEVGHSLGMTHDGPPHNNCRPHQYIMTSKYHPRYHPKTWSRCSKTDLQRFLKSRKGWCAQKIHATK